MNIPSHRASLNGAITTSPGTFQPSQSAAPQSAVSQSWKATHGSPTNQHGLRRSASFSSLRFGPATIGNGHLAANAGVVPRPGAHTPMGPELPASTPIDLMDMLARGHMPDPADREMIRFLFTKDLTDPEKRLVEAFHVGTAPAATQQDRDALRLLLDRRRTITALSSDPRAPTANGLMSLLRRGRMPSTDAHDAALAALSLELTPLDAELLTAYLNGASTRSSPAERNELASKLRVRRFLSGFEADATPATGPAARASAHPAASSSPVAQSTLRPTNERPAEVVRSVVAFKRLLEGSATGHLLDNTPWQPSLPIGSSTDAAVLLYRSLVHAAHPSALVDKPADVERLSALAPHLEAVVDELARQPAVCGRDAAFMRAAIPRVRTAIQLMREFPGHAHLNYRFIDRTLTLPPESRAPDAQPDSDMLEPLAAALNRWVFHMSIDEFVGRQAAQSRLIDRAQEVGLIGPSQRDWIARRCDSVVDQEKARQVQAGQAGQAGTPVVTMSTSELSHMRSRLAELPPNVRSDAAAGTSRPIDSTRPPPPVPIGTDVQTLIRHLQTDFRLVGGHLVRLGADIRGCFHRGDLDVEAATEFDRKYAGCIQGSIADPANKNRFIVLAMAIEHLR